MGVLVDSSIIIDYERKRLDFLERSSERETDVFISVVTVSELLQGVYLANSSKLSSKRLQIVERVIGAIPIINIDIAIARSHAQLWGDLVKSGKAIGVQDSWLAATCLTYALRIATRNLKEFRQVPGLEIENW